jgi:hypothetical protein
MNRLIVSAFAAVLLRPASLRAQVNPVSDFVAGVAVFATDGDASGARRTLVGWQVSVSQKVKGAVEAATTKDTPISIVGDFGRQSGMYEFMGGVRVRAVSRRRRESVFAHALFGGTTRGGDTSAGTGFMMGDGTWSATQFRIAFGLVFLVRYWD